MTFRDLSLPDVFDSLIHATFVENIVVKIIYIFRRLFRVLYLATTDDGVGVGDGFDKPQKTLERSNFKTIITIEKSNKFPISFIKARISYYANTLVGFKPYQLNLAIILAKILANLEASISGSIVDKDDLQLGAEIIKKAV